MVCMEHVPFFPPDLIQLQADWCRVDEALAAPGPACYALAAPSAGPTDVHQAITRAAITSGRKPKGSRPK